VTDAPPKARERHTLRHAVTGPVARLVVSAAVVVAVFAGVLPQITDYTEAWRLVRRLTAPEAAVIAAVAAVTWSRTHPCGWQHCQDSRCGAP
jgi:hypothetical protein